MTIRDAGDSLIWLGAVCGALGAIALIGRYAVLKPLERYIDRVLVKPLALEVATVRRGLADHLKAHRSYRRQR